MGQVKTHVYGAMCLEVIHWIFDMDDIVTYKGLAWLIIVGYRFGD
jgi:hypothetical protein